MKRLLSTVFAVLFLPTVSGEGEVRHRFVRPRCKNVTVSVEQYQVLEDDSLFVPSINQTFDVWNETVKNEQAVICLPFSEEFFACRRWKLNREEFEFRDEGFRIWVHEYQKLYGPGDFYIRHGQEAVICIEENTEDQKTEIVTPLAVTWAISAVSLIVALPLCLIFVRTSYRFLLPFYMISLFIGYIILIRRAFGPVPSRGECTIYGILLQFTLLSAFFWLNVVAFHVWRCVSRIQKGIEDSFTSLLLFGYIAYAWGIPLFITLVSFLVDSHQLFPEATWLQPDFSSNCWFGGRLPTLIFFYIPMGVVLTANVVFFILTIMNINDASKYYSCKPTFSKKKLIGTALHLVVIMGLCWIMEGLSWAIAGDPRFWYFTDLLNGLQGFFVLLVVIADTRLLSKISYFQHKDSPDTASTITEVSTVSNNEKSTP